jgi:hypothetical protein
MVVTKCSDCDRIAKRIRFSSTDNANVGQLVLIVNQAVQQDIETHFHGVCPNIHPPYQHALT